MHVCAYIGFYIYIYIYINICIVHMFYQSIKIKYEYIVPPAQAVDLLRIFKLRSRFLRLHIGTQLSIRVADTRRLPMLTKQISRNNIYE